MPKLPPKHQPPRIPGAKRDLRPSASKRGYDEAWKRVRAAFLMANPLCVALLRDGRRCGRPALHVDHKVSLEKGGSNDADNLQGLCHSCHSRKTCAVDGGLARPRAYP